MKPLALKIKIILVSVSLIASIGINTHAQIVVTGSNGADGSYTQLRLAFNAINAQPNQAGRDIDIWINANTTETAPAQLNRGTQEWTTLEIRPGTAGIVISGNISDNGLIILNGARNVRIDGWRLPANRELTIRNISDNNLNKVSTIRFVNDASNNIVSFCNIEGSGQSLTSGTILFDTGVSTGNDNNTINSNFIRPAGGLFHSNAIYSNGSSISINNSANVISGNWIQDVVGSVNSHGIFLETNNSDWIIDGNRFFWTTYLVSDYFLQNFGIRIVAPNGNNFQLNNNVIGFANASGTGFTNFESDPGGIYFRGIELTVGSNIASSVQGNTIAGINLTTPDGLGIAPGAFSGISVLGGAVNIGNVTANIIGSSTGTGAINVNFIAGVGGSVTGISVFSNNSVTISNNQIGSFIINGTITNDISFIGIYINGSVNNLIENNLIGSTSTPNSISFGSVVSQGKFTFSGITCQSSGGTSIINLNTIRNISISTTYAPFCYGIRKNAGTSNISITNNNIISLSITNNAYGELFPILNSAAIGNLTIDSNVIRNHIIDSPATLFNGILQSGTITGSINITNNQLGNSVGGLVTIIRANSAGSSIINNQMGAQSSTSNISGNNIQGISYTLPTTSNINLITNLASSQIQNISDNTFTNLSLNSSGSINIIFSNSPLSTSGVQIIDNNRIIGNFTKTASGGDVKLFSGGFNSDGATITHTNNNFSNITLTGTTNIMGWWDIGNGNNVRNINGNTFSNWNIPTGAITVMNLNGFTGNSSVSNNTISNINGIGAITGINLGANGNATLLNVSSNTVSSLNSTGTSGLVTGISSTNPSAVVTLHQNTVHTLASSLGSTADITYVLRGIYVSNPNTVNVTSNTIHTLTANGIATGTSRIWVNAIHGDNGGSINLHDNTIHSIYGIGGNPTTNVFVGVIITSGSWSNISVYNNIIGNATANNIVAGDVSSFANNIRLFGIYNSANVITHNVSNNTIQNLTNRSSGSSLYAFIHSITGGTLTNFTDNTLVNGTSSGSGANTSVGILNDGSPTTLNITGNIIRNNVINNTTGRFNGILQRGNVTGSITIDNNQLGNVNGGLVRFTTANSGGFSSAIDNTGGGSATLLSISGNNIQGIVFEAGKSTDYTIIRNTFATRTQTISNNTFTNLNLNSTGSVTIIDNAVSLSATGTQTFDNNRIVTAFTKPAAGGTVTIFNNTAVHAAGATATHINNNFSNITLTGATTMVGWSVTGTGNIVRNISGNTFSNWTVPTGAITVMSINGFTGNSSVSNNTISNINGIGAITGINLGANGNATLLNVSSNTVSSLNSTGTSGLVTGISSTNPSAVVTLHQNTVHTLASSLGATVDITYVLRGIYVSNPNTVNVTSNTIHTLTVTGTATAPARLWVHAIQGDNGGTITIQDNTIHTINGLGGNTTTPVLVGVINTSGAWSSISVRNNIIGNTTANNIVAGVVSSTANNIRLFGIYNSASVITHNVTGNTVQNLTNRSSGASLFAFIHSNTGGTLTNVTGNTLLNGTSGGSDTNTSVGILNDGSPATLNITGNIIRSNVIQHAQGRFTGILQRGTITASINIDNNQLGNSDGGLVRFTTANSGGFSSAIDNTGGSSTTLLTISGNNIQGIVFEAGKSTDYTIIRNTIATRTQTISNNTFTNLNLNSTGSVTIIDNAVSLSATGTQTLDNNRIVTAFNKTASGGTVTIFNSSAVHAAGATVNHNNNNFSNITLTGTTTIVGWSDTGIGNIVRYINGNTFSNWNIPNGAITVMNLNGFTGNSTVSSNTISSINGTGAVTGINIGANGNATLLVVNNNNISQLSSTGAGGKIMAIAAANPSNALNINLNTIHSLSTTMSSAATGDIFVLDAILVTGSLNTSINSNTIYNLTVSGSASSIDGALWLRAIHNHSNGSANILNNTIHTITMAGGSPTSRYSSSLIDFLSSGGGVFTITGNVIGNTTPHNVVVGNVGNSNSFCYSRGMGGLLTNGRATITGNIIQNATIRSTAPSTMRGIIFHNSTMIQADISDNQFLSLTHSSQSDNISSFFTIIEFIPSVPLLNINRNIIRNHTSTATNNAFIGINQSGVVSGTLNINDNQLGNNDGGLVTFSANTAGQLIGIQFSGTGSTPTLSISGNNFQGINHAVQGTLSHTYISNTATNAWHEFNNNTFTNLNVNTTGNVTFISNTVPLTSSGFQTFNNNRIVTAFNKTASGGTVTIFNSSAVHATGSTVTHTNNNFSNITLTGTTAMVGWSDTGTGNSVRNISGNTFSNWTIPGGGTNVLSINGFSGNSSVSNNTISNINTSSSIFGLIIGSNGNASSLEIRSNNINNITSSSIVSIVGISSSSNSTQTNIINNTIHTISSNMLVNSVIGIQISVAGSIHRVSQNTIHGLQANMMTSGSILGISVALQNTSEVERNKIYNLSSSSSAITTGLIVGIAVAGSSSSANSTIVNNLVSDIRVTAGSGTNLINGIFINTTSTNSNINLYHNTIFLNAPTTSGANLGTSGVFHAASATGTTARLDMRNNIIVNISEFKGSGTTVAFRRSAGTAGMLANYASTSNRNLFFAGTPGPSRLIYSDGTSSAQTIAAYRSGTFTAGNIAPRDAASISEMPFWLNTNTNDTNYLKINPFYASQIESGASNIPGITSDFSGTIRHGNVGYIGTGTAPDIGAFETDINTFLPIELLYFEAKPILNYVKLNWATASETNNDFFTIERSTDTKNWEIINNIDGAGNTSNSIDYKSYDYNPHIGLSYYRLKQTDFDGQYTYSPIREVRFEKNENNISFFPNPAQNTLYFSSNNNSMKVEIINYLGQTILTELNPAEIDLSNLRNGLYFVKITFEDQSTQVSRLVIKK